MYRQIVRYLVSKLYIWSGKAHSWAWNKLYGQRAKVTK